jgi:hypothetical protein
MAVNVHGPLHMAQSFAPVLKANGGGVYPGFARDIVEADPMAG